jgi:hypothetical protein
MDIDDRLEVRLVGARDLSESESEGDDPGVVVPDGAFWGEIIEICPPPFFHSESLRRTGVIKHKKQETPSPKNCWRSVMGGGVFPSTRRGAFGLSTVWRRRWRKSRE